MRTVDLEQTTLDRCVSDAQSERIILTRDGKPVALVIGVEGMDAEQLALGVSEKFWTLVAERRGEGTVSRAELEEKINHSLK